MPLWLIIVIVVLIVLAAGGVIARRRQLARTRPAFERSLTQADRDLAAAAASGRGWDRAELRARGRRASAAAAARGWHPPNLEAPARRAYADQHGAEPDDLVLVEVLDRPGTDEDEAVFESAGRRVVLGRRGDVWSARSSG